MIKPFSMYILLGAMCFHHALIHTNVMDAQQADETAVMEKGCCKPRPSCCNPCNPTAPRPCNTNCNSCCREGEMDMEMEKGCCKPRPSCCNPCNPTAPRPCNTSCNSCCREGEMDMEVEKGCCKPRPSCCNPCNPTAPRPCNTSCNSCCREMEEGPMVERGCCKPRPSCCNPCNPTAPRPCVSSCNSCCRDFDMVEIKEVNPSIMTEMRYASENNCCKQALCKDVCVVRSAVAKALDAVQKELEMMGMGLKVWDAYRPMSMQEKLWNMCPDERYMVNPSQPDYNCCGLAVSATLVDLLAGEECEMPSDFNEFSSRAHCDNADCSMMAQRNYHILHDVMVKHGFKSYPEQWHYFYVDQCQDCTPLDVVLE